MKSMQEHPNYQAIRELISSLVKSGLGVEEIRSKFRHVYGDIFDVALSDFIEAKKNVYILKDPQAIAAEKFQSEKYQWYAGPAAHSIRWNSLKRVLENQGLGTKELLNIDRASTKVVSLLPSPASSTFSGRGLVLGHVQSGKTTNFMSTIAKAADEGYRLIVVLSGTTNNLRNQTQFRIEKSFSDDYENLAAGKSWHWLTSAEKDFDVSSNAANLLATPNIRVIAVVKKNKGRLKKLLTWLQTAPETVRAEVPFLLVDDEADQASVNSAKKLEQQTAINKLVTDLLDTDLMPKNAYVGYTATPFANVLSDAKNVKQIYPRDFILPLSKGEGYFGAEELFGRDPIDEEEHELCAGRNIIRPVYPHEISPLGSAAYKNVSEDMPEFTEALGRSIFWFFIATSIRRYRAKKIQFSTMLVHTSGAIQPHFEMKKLIETEITRINSSGLDSHEIVFKKLWEEEIDLAHLQEDGELPSWQELWPIIKCTIQEAKVIVDNYRSDDRLNYDFENELNSNPVIVIGGNTLSRGLTLEGLVSTFFLRTSTAYDSLLQMGRWFGYRPGYEDLQRIWMQDDLIPLFRDLALVEHEIRSQISEWNNHGIRPDELAVRIRTHPSMNITAREKMLHAVRVQIGFSKQRVESINFRNDAAWLSQNIASTENFISDCIRSGFTLEKNLKEWPIFYDLPWGLVKNFLSKYNWVEDHPKATLNLIVKYIERVQSNKSELDKWNVFFYQLKNPNFGSRNLCGIDLSRITRSALMQNESYSNIHTLVSSIDGAADLPLTDSEIREYLDSRVVTDKKIIDLRQKYYPEGRGLLGIYLIDKNSKSNSKRRVDLNLVEDALALGFFFPNSSDPSAIIEYVAAQLPELETSYDDEDMDILESADTER